MPADPRSPFAAPALALSRRLALAAGVACLAASLSGCGVVAVAGAATGAAISVAGAVVSTGVKVTGKVIEKTIDVVTPSTPTPEADLAAKAAPAPAPAPAPTPAPELPK